MMRDHAGLILGLAFAVGGIVSGWALGGWHGAVWAFLGECGAAVAAYNTAWWGI